MNEELIKKHNAKVGKYDTVWDLGDVFFGQFSKAYPLILRLNGRRNLILGNHDHVTPEFINCFQEVMTWKKMKYHNIVLSHFPLHPQQLMECVADGMKEVTNVHGHIHNNDSPKPVIVDGVKLKWLNISVERTNYEPLSLDEIKEKIKEI